MPTRQQVYWVKTTITITNANYLIMKVVESKLGALDTQESKYSVKHAFATFGILYNMYLSLTDMAKYYGNTHTNAVSADIWIMYLWDIKQSQNQTVRCLWRPWGQLLKLLYGEIRMTAAYLSEYTVASAKWHELHIAMRRERPGTYLSFLGAICPQKTEYSGWKMCCQFIWVWSVYYELLGVLSSLKKDLPIDLSTTKYLLLLKRDHISISTRNLSSNFSPLVNSC